MHVLRMMAAVSAAWLGGLLLSGCVNANVNVGNPDAWADYGVNKGMQKLAKSQAIRMAKDAAIQRGLTEGAFDRYKIKADSSGKNWWVTFEMIKGGGSRVWPEYFVVRVDPQGNTVVYEDPSQRPSKDD